MDPRGPHYDKAEVARRMKAARALAGLSAEKLAERINEDGLKVGVLRAMEQKRHGQPKLRNLRVIALACGLPAEWFWMPSIREAIDCAAQMLNVSSEARFDELAAQWLAGDEPTPGQAPEAGQDDDDQDQADSGG